MEKCYNVINLHCAHCGSKIEAEINKIDGIEKAVLSFPNKKIKVTGKVNKDTERQMQAVCDRIENGVLIQAAEDKHEHHHEHSHENENIKLTVISLAIGVVLFAAAVLTEHFTDFSPLFIYISAYIVLGYNVLHDTVHGIKNKNFFDENFLMTIATIGAFVLGEYSEAVGVVLFYKIGTLFEHYAVEKSRNAISSISKLKVDKADVLVNGEFQKIESEKIQIGDIIRVKNGERTAVDGVIESGSAYFDTSAISGESMPVELSVGDSVVSGYINISDVVTIRATAISDDSMIAKIAEAIEDAAESKPKTEKFITRFSKIYTLLVIFAALTTAIVPSIITNNWEYWVYTALTFLVISCPCAIVLSVPLAYFSGIGVASKLGILFKGGSVIESLSSVKNVVFDKTGTLTNGEFSVINVAVNDGFNKERLLEIAYMCESSSNHPVAFGVCRYCDNVRHIEADKISEIRGRGISALKGSDKYLCGNIKLMKENNIDVDETADSNGNIIYISENCRYIGKIILSDTLKESAEETIKRLKKNGKNVAMLTGDRAENAVETAEKLGINECFSELLPQQKLDELKKISRKSGASMFVGDGINDGIVLAGADVGATICKGTDLAIEAADVVLMSDNLRLIVTAQKVADKTVSVAKQNIVFALIIKVLVILLGFSGFANMWFAVFADSGVAMLLALNSVKLLNSAKYK